MRKNGTELTGPCPHCGGRDRFNISLRTHLFLCRRCGITGGDTIALVQKVLGCSFPEALDYLLGAAPARVNEAERRRRLDRARRDEERRAREAEHYRQNAIRDAREIWAAARPGHLGVVPAYLAARGIPVEALGGVPAALRFTLHHPYIKKVGARREVLYRGPAMIAGVLSPEGAVMAVHQTWVDPEPPHGKARIRWCDQDFPAKLVRGSKKGNAIRLITPEDADTLVMGEGIETTLSAAAADLVPGAAYWAGVDLGNMAGRMRREEGIRYSGKPDMADADAFVPPPWVRRLIYILDGDSEPVSTRAKLQCGLRRAMTLRPGLRGQIVPAGEGVDLNDVWQRGEA